MRLTAPVSGNAGAETLIDKKTVAVDPDTGAKKQAKLARFDLIPPKALYELAERYGLGPSSGRYEDNNWRKGYDWGLSYAALQRHAALFWAGEDYDLDAEKEMPGFRGKHVIAMAWHCLTLATFMDEHPEKDDRFKPRPSFCDEDPPESHQCS
jgi:hypothetical protein